MNNSNMVLTVNKKYDISLSEKIAGMSVLVLKNSKSNDFLYKILADNYNLKISFDYSPEKADLIVAEINNSSDLAKIQHFRKNNVVPFVCISDRKNSGEKIEAYKKGVNLYIEKPYDLNLIQAQITGILLREHDRKILQEEKDTFVASITHDLRSPLNAQMYALNSILNSKESLSVYQKEVLNDLTGSVQYMKIITENILTKYKNENTDLTLNMLCCSFKNLTEKCISELKYITNSKNQKISLYSSKDDISGNFDFVLIRRVINNLISNASEYTPENGQIDIKIEETVNKIIFNIKDNGYGVENSATIFEKYVSHARKNKKIGYGLGLHICKKIIEAHKGEIFITSELNKGTLVSFYLPKIYH